MTKILMAFDEGRRTVGEIAAMRAEHYANSRGYKFVYRPDVVHPRPNPFWIKVKAVREELNGCDWLLWLDSDALVVDTSYEVERLTQEDKSLVISTDRFGLCVGVFLLKNCEWSHQFLSTWGWLGPVKDTKCLDQPTVKHLVDNWPEVGNQVGYIPEEIVQNPMTVTSKPPFIFHYWTQWNNLDQVAACMRAVVSNGWCQEARLVNSPAA